VNMGWPMIIWIDHHPHGAEPENRGHASA
jgi:hypothetical protein